MYLEAAVLVLLLLLYRLLRPSRVSKMAAQFPGLPPLPIIGNLHQLGISFSNDVYELVEFYAKKFYGSPFRVWLGSKLLIVLTRPQDFQIVMSSQKFIGKGESYKLLHPWLGTGLLTSSGEKWRRHRKILNPTFHFKILEQFVQVFDSNGQILADCLRSKVGGPAIDLHHFMSLNALDNICETAMGLKINAVKESDSEYVKAVKWQSDCTLKMAVCPWLQIDLIFFLSGMRGEYRRTLQILHSSTDSVIKSRKNALLKERTENAGETKPTEDGTKRRLAFLDLLIESAWNGSGMTDENLREEVDTFMFEGHDTVSAAITFTIWMLSWHQDIQDAAVQEILQVWPDPEEPLTYQHLQDLKLLDRILKEGMRLYPSVPIISRQATEDVQLSDGKVIPRGVELGILVFFVHKDPEIFPDPEKFDPDRFLPENVQARHPYAYVPFSTGPRNCIGQKFAMVEMKCTLAHLLRQLRFTPGAPSPRLKLCPTLILTAKEGVPVKVNLRS